MATPPPPLSPVPPPPPSPPLPIGPPVVPPFAPPGNTASIIVFVDTSNYPKQAGFNSFRCIEIAGVLQTSQPFGETPEAVNPFWHFRFRAWCQRPLPALPGLIDNRYATLDINTAGCYAFDYLLGIRKNDLDDSTPIIASLLATGDTYNVELNLVVKYDPGFPDGTTLYNQTLTLPNVTLT